MAIDLAQMGLQGAVQLAATLVGGGIAAITGFKVAERSVSAATAAREEERQQRRDDYQLQVLTELQSVLVDLHKATGDEVSEMEKTGQPSKDAAAREFIAHARARVLAGQVRERTLRSAIVDHLESRNRLILLHQPGDQLKTITELLGSISALEASMSAELDKYL